MTPSLLQLELHGRATGVVLVTHGGKARSTAADSHLRGPAMRMLPFSADLARAGRRRGLLVAQLRYRLQGYNDGDAVEDVSWALDRLAAHNVPICIVGHSMGARAALRSAGHPAVTAVAALAPWLPPDEPVAQLDGRTLLIVHGLADRITSPARSAEYVRRARRFARGVRYVEIARSGHAMLQRPLVWHRLVRQFCLEQLGLAVARPTPAMDEVRL
jgi:pimeloyl-ACP methyl ester carboxylesterase